MTYDIQKLLKARNIFDTAMLESEKEIEKVIQQRFTKKTPDREKKILILVRLISELAKDIVTEWQAFRLPYCEEYYKGDGSVKRFFDRHAWRFGISVVCVDDDEIYYGIAGRNYGEIRSGESNLLLNVFEADDDN